MAAKTVQTPPKASPFKVAMLANLQLVNWLTEQKLEPLLQGWDSSKGIRPWVLINYQRGKCERLKREYDSEVVARRGDEQGVQLRFEIEVHGCIVQWIEREV